MERSLGLLKDVLLDRQRFQLVVLAVVLVTGGSGFLGSQLCEQLLAHSATVLCVDNFFTGNRQNIELPLDDKHFELTKRGGETEYRARHS